MLLDLLPYLQFPCSQNLQTGMAVKFSAKCRRDSFSTTGQKEAHAGARCYVCDHGMTGVTCLCIPGFLLCDGNGDVKRNAKPWQLVIIA